ncbi:sulfotransferase [Gramella jeungdoensis]|uniref:Sulfotransferase n=1 Tax=Gramella jeungdoensis TaxID=708091 RepID=A0ABT0Z0E3_9FLAO|nr:sulfotransferase [Gramella jeungdoensis]
MQALLSNNRDTNTCSESWILLNYANQIKPSLIHSTFDNNLAKDAFEEYLNKHNDFNFLEHQKKFLLDLYQPLGKGYRYVIDKTPRYWEILPEIRELFPKSKIIVIKRNPIEVARSIFKTWNVEQMQALTAYKRDLLFGPGRITEFEKNNKDNSRNYFLRYEDLLNNTESVVRNLYYWMDVTFTSDILKINNNVKYKGKFGDPYLNSNKDYQKIKAESRILELSKLQMEFLDGYANFLGPEFLMEYGEYKYDMGTAKKTLAFSHFIHLNNNQFENYNFKERMKAVIKEKIFRLLNK